MRYAACFWFQSLSLLLQMWLSAHAGLKSHIIYISSSSFLRDKAIQSEMISTNFLSLHDGDHRGGPRHYRSNEAQLLSVLINIFTLAFVALKVTQLTNQHFYFKLSPRTLGIQNQSRKLPTHNSHHTPSSLSICSTNVHGPCGVQPHIFWPLE